MTDTKPKPLFFSMRSIFRVWNGEVAELLPYVPSEQEPRLNPRLTQERLGRNNGFKRSPQRSQQPSVFFSGLRTRSGHTAWQMLSDFVVHHDQLADADLATCKTCHRKCIPQQYQAGSIIVKFGAELRVVSPEEFNTLT